jgi:hypothetical protein
MTAEHIAELRRLLAGATPGSLGRSAVQNAELMCAAINALPELLDAAEAYIRLTQEGDAGMIERLQRVAAECIARQRAVNKCAILTRLLRKALKDERLSVQCRFCGSLTCNSEHDLPAHKCDDRLWWEKENGRDG